MKGNTIDEQLKLLRVLLNLPKTAPPELVLGAAVRQILPSFKTKAERNAGIYSEWIKGARTEDIAVWAGVSRSQVCKIARRIQRERERERGQRMGIFEAALAYQRAAAERGEPCNFKTALLASTRARSATP